MTKINPQKCVCCGLEWRDREPIIYKNGENPDSKSTPIITKTELISHHGKKTIKLLFCDKHFSNLHVTKYMNKTGILKIRNVITNKWRYASALGDVV